MKQFLNALKAENLKLKHTGIKFIAYILAVLIPVIILAVNIYQFFTETDTLNSPNYLFYSEFNEVNPTFTGFIYPLIIIIIVSRITQIEHKNNTWQLLETQPIKRAILINAKFIKIYQICITCIVLFFASILLNVVVTYLLHKSNPNYILEIPWFLLLKKFISLTIGTGFFLAIIYAVSVRFSSYIFTIIIGLGSLLIAPILDQFKLLPKWFPTKILSNSLLKTSDLGNILTYNEYLSIIATVIIMLLLTFWYVFKNKKWMITDRSKVITIYFVPAIILLAAFIFVLKPKQLMQSNEIAITGTLPENSNVNALYLLDTTMDDTLHVIKVNNNSFNYKIANDMPLKNYRLMWTDEKGMHRNVVIFSTNDIVNVQFEDESKNQSFKILGSRLAENNLNFELSSNYNYINQLANEGDEASVAIITQLLNSEYKSDIKTISKFHTSDNYAVREDYAKIKKSEVYYKYRLIWEQYKDLVVRSNPKFEQKDQKIEDIIDVDFTPDENILANAEVQDYFRYKIYEITSKDTSDQDVISKYVKGIKNIKNNTLQTQLAKAILLDNLSKVNDIDELLRYENDFLPLINDAKSKTYYTNYINEKKKLTKGSLAFSFNAITPNNEKVTLNNFKGKYVVIDFWATWCGPCIYQAPYFEKHAIEYNKRGDIVFVSLSVDEKQSNWRKKVKLNDKNVTQLYALNIDELSKFYRLNSIPRFIIIDPEGKLVNSEFAFPTDTNFKEMLDQILPKK
ncbi:ABC transporter permease [Flavobacterium sp. xlx-214]|uniref:ABC transporter permease n=1 Tax=unclassified Flavobacterium TaxID=196869 RepID=UPI0013D4F965|nr:MULTISPECIES: ABC transporter permease [unclassified Flavobacterium]MBA5792564.1 ABC transporter permease [Flavobacterium sp. xlx-221]QMI83714.1 ABC transporter permease [Flavobacterium sp. xlx-214]